MEYEMEVIPENEVVAMLYVTTKVMMGIYNSKSTMKNNHQKKSHRNCTEVILHKARILDSQKNCNEI